MATVSRKRKLGSDDFAYEPIKTEILPIAGEENVLVTSALPYCQ